MMYGGATHTPNSMVHTHTTIPSCHRPTSLLATNITSSFCVLPLTTNNKGFGSFCGLRLALSVIPTGLRYAFVNRFLISMFHFTVSVKHFTCLAIKFCHQQWRRSMTAGYGGVCVYHAIGCVCGPPVHHHLVVQNGILGICFVFSFLFLVFLYKGLFSIFGLLSYLVQKTRLTSSLHFFKWFFVSIVYHATLTKGSNHCFKWRGFMYEVRQLRFEGGGKG